MTDSAIAKKSRRQIWIPLLVLVALLACAAAGYAWWRLQHQPAAEASKAPPPPAAPVFWALDTFTVNLGDADRVLYIGITLRLKDEATRARNE
ncbi:flagellar basal body-associated protein FliL [Pluralibacter gergoviae]|nr:flagellar basal body-associated protein FliL [Pluralibacter gergoviae]